MTTTNDIATDVENDAGRHADAGFGATSNFRFLPGELAVKCRALVESYHDMFGYGCLPDMLWHSAARDVIESDRGLAQLFKNASRSRYAKRANDTLLLIASIVVSLEMLARDFAGWGKRFPTLKREAETLLGGAPLRPRVWLMDMYLFPSSGVHRKFLSALARSATAGPATTRS